MSQPVHTLTSAEFVGDVTGAMQMAAEGNTVLITDGGEPAWVLLDIDMCRRLITGVTELSSGDARPHRPLDDYLRIILWDGSALLIGTTPGAHSPRWPPQTAPLLASQTAPGRTG